MDEETLDLQATKAFYSAAWKKALGELLGWSEQRITTWMQQFPDDVNEWTWFSHETPTYWIARELIPDWLQKRLTPLESLRLAGRLDHAIEYGARPPLPEILDVPGALPPSEWMDRYKAYMAEVVANGQAVVEGTLDTFDWKAARRRIDKILDEYGPPPC